ncbi:hypothetical protein ACET3Z_021773 [Daucus carota]
MIQRFLQGLANSSSLILSGLVADHDYVIDCLPIYKAAIEDDWETAERIFEEENRDINGPITYFSETALHVAVGTNSSHRFVEKLVEMIMAFKEAVGYTPLTLAALCGHRETLCYLLELTEDVNYTDPEISPFYRKNGADLLCHTITAGLYDVALYLVKMYPDLVTEKNSINLQTGFQTLAAKPNAFQSGSKLGFWQQLIYSLIPVDREKALKAPIVRASQVGTMQTQTSKASDCLNFSFWSVLRFFGKTFS